MILRCFQAHKTIRWWQVHKATIFWAKTSQTISNISPTGIFENIQSLQQKRRIPTGIFFDYCIHFNNATPTHRGKLKSLKVCTRFSTMQCLQYNPTQEDFSKSSKFPHHTAESTHRGTLKIFFKVSAHYSISIEIFEKIKVSTIHSTEPYARWSFENFQSLYTQGKIKEKSTSPSYMEFS